jgi:hypothetical protein
MAAGKENPPPSKDDRDSQGKADFSAYWSLKFREFFSKRRQYLELSRKRQEPPAIFQKIDEQIKVQEEKLEAARMQARYVLTAVLPMQLNLDDTNRHHQHSQCSPHPTRQALTLQGLMAVVVNTSSCMAV